MLATAVTLLLIAAATLYLLFPRKPATEAAFLVDSKTKLASLLDHLAQLPTNGHKPDLYCDLEGINLCRHGTISLLSIYVLPIDSVYLIDVHNLRDIAFTFTNSDGYSLKSILESEVVLKVFFDVRNDSDALFALYGIALCGIRDLQLMEVGARYGGSEMRKYVSSLTRCITRHSRLSQAEKDHCQKVKERGAQLFVPQQGGRYEVFNQRPLSTAIIDYCSVDVRVLPDLYERYDGILKQANKKDWRKRVEKATRERVRESQSQDHMPNGPHKVLSPWQM